jgi:hypothetical protein
MAELLNAEQMLRQLNEHGQDAGSDYNDSEEVDGYFGWEVEGDVLVVTHEISEDSNRRNPEVTRRWRLVPIEAS